MPVSLLQPPNASAMSRGAVPLSMIPEVHAVGSSVLFGRGSRTASISLAII
jgi:hypothetical protein